MEPRNRQCPGTHRYKILRAFEFENKYMFYLYCDKCGLKKRFAIKRPHGSPLDITQTYVNTKQDN